MKKLMKNNVMKLVVCAGVFCGTNFGMEKEHTIINIPKMNLYVAQDSGNYCTYRVIEQDGTYSEIDQSTLSTIRLSKRFGGGSLAKSQDEKHCVQGNLDYANYVALNRGDSTNVVPCRSDFIVPIKCTEAQLKEVVRLCNLTQKRDNVFVVGQYNARLDIASISLDVSKIVEELRLDDEREGKEARMRFLEECQKSRDDKYIKNMITIACCSCLLGCGIFLSNF